MDEAAAQAPVPSNNRSSWITTADYPARALREKREGVTRFRLLISDRGRITDCQILVSSGSPDLDAATCTALRKRARFTPARDARGQPVTSEWTQNVRWAIPE